MLKLNNTIKYTQRELRLIRALTGLTDISEDVQTFDTQLENATRNIEDGSPEGRLLAGMIRLSKSTPQQTPA